MGQTVKTYDLFNDILKRYLQKMRLRNSDSRDQLLKFLCLDKNGLNPHFEAEEIYFELKKQNYQISRASVFRNLTLFTDAYILRKSKFGENHFHYELCNDQSYFHHHLICKKCGKVVEFKSTQIKKHATKAAKSNNFYNIEYRFEIFGVCKDCKKGK
ncbi:MAG: transcriptional repressor [Candidatus Delongbacteria bacterium]|jgi:Fur family ferric uptake transcriptional regulator|nr:transcriptional repressor [Candidatus Delongbacteria bacterium]